MCEGEKAINVFSAIKSRSEWTEDGGDFIIIYIISQPRGTGGGERSGANERARAAVGRGKCIFRRFTLNVYPCRTENMEEKNISYYVHVIRSTEANTRFSFGFMFLQFSFSLYFPVFFYLSIFRLIFASAGAYVCR